MPAVCPEGHPVSFPLPGALAQGRHGDAFGRVHLRGAGVCGVFRAVMIDQKLRRRPEDGVLHIRPRVRGH